MIWDRLAGVYDIAETVYNGKVYRETGKIVADEIEMDDAVLECACGTGSITKFIAYRASVVYAGDISEKMLDRCRHNCREFCNIRYRKIDITDTHARDDAFDKVVAGNVIHLLDDPQAAVRELLRVCRPGGKVIIPTYINVGRGASKAAVSVVSRLGVDFRESFTIESYQKFFEDMGIEATYRIALGTMPCAVAVIEKKCDDDQSR